VNPLLAAQVYDSQAFLDLGAAVGLIGRARLGDPACSVKLAEDEGAEAQVDVAFGTLAILPLAPGRTGKLTLRPRAGFNAGYGPGRAHTLKVKGGVLGIVIDARGRPVALPRAAEQRQELVKQWTWKMGGV